jgi:serine O-acetyltransferase
MLRIIKDPLPWYRAAHWLYGKKVPLIPWLITYWIRFFYTAFLPPTAEIGSGTRLGYGGLGVVIHKDARIGRDCLVAQQVTIGGTGTRLGVPIIGDGVQIGAGAKILGPIKIGEGAVIGANAVVVKDVPPRAVVGGVPARILPQTTHELKKEDDQGTLS